MIESYRSISFKFNEVNVAPTCIEYGEQTNVNGDSS